MVGSRTILIVDDEEDIRTGVAFWMRAAGFETIAAHDGETGVTEARKCRPDLILLDVLMPNKNGMQALAELKSKAETEKIPVVMLSASLRDEQRSLDAGAAFFLQKPYDSETLVSTVHAAMAANTALEYAL